MLTEPLDTPGCQSDKGEIGAAAVIVTFFLLFHKIGSQKCSKINKALGGAWRTIVTVSSAGRIKIVS